jgi:hypothetical protein
MRSETFRRAVHAGATLVCLLAVVPLRAEEPSVPALTIRLYDTFGLTGREIVAAQDVAGLILHAAGVDARWRECWRDADAARDDVRVCDGILRPDELIVRVVTDQSDRQGKEIALGYSLIVPQGEGATFATVFGNRVTEVAQRVRTDRTILLGRAIAHEVGHLLLGTGAHGIDGLMRGHWPDRTLRTHDDWEFSRQEAGRIRAELLARSGRRPERLTAAGR